MKDRDFQELLESVREGGAILRGKKKAARSTVVKEPDAKAIRERFNLSQPMFAALLDISVKTLQNWEHGRRKPHGPARWLLQIVERHPEVLLASGSITEKTGRKRRPKSRKQLVDA